ncbi:hypothetical protein [Mollivirus kamchatka]|nr:hypothetical protein [Mollivirus kamchatka]
MALRQSILRLIMRRAACRRPTVRRHCDSVLTHSRHVSGVVDKGMSRAIATVEVLGDDTAHRDWRQHQPSEFSIGEYKLRRPELVFLDGQLGQGMDAPQVKTALDAVGILQRLWRFLGV